MQIKKQYVHYGRVQSKQNPASGRTHQCFKDECDINNLVRHWEKTGVAQFTPRNAQYGDISGFQDIDYRNDIVALEQEFEQLPAKLKEEYGTPLGYLDALEKDDQNVGTDPSLVVTVPTDTTSNNPAGKEVKDDAKKKDEPSE